MSRIGKKPIQIPAQVKISVENDLLTVNGPKGTLTRPLNPAVAIKIEDGILRVASENPDDRKSVALQGMYRALIQNMVTGVANGYERTLLLSGIGYKAELNGNTIVLNVGYSNPVSFVLPSGITAKVDKNTQIVLSSIDKENLGATAANIRRIRPPEPYKGKGIMYSDETIIKKAGKAAAK